MAPQRHPGFASGTRLWLLRHAEVDAAWQGRAYGDLDVPLSDEGRRVTADLATAFAPLRSRRILTSPLSRARELGEALAEATGAPLETLEGLREIHRGSWQGRPVEELEREEGEAVRAFYADPWTYTGHGGECDRDILTRAWPAVERAVVGPPGGEVVLTTHYNVIRVLAARLLGLDPARSFALRIDPGRGMLLVDGPLGWELQATNTAEPGAGVPA